MPSKKSGKEVKKLAPTTPTEPHAADRSDPGAVELASQETANSDSGKYGSQPVQPFEAPLDTQSSTEPTSWIELQLEDELGNPIGGERYEIKLADGSTARGSLGSDGRARVSGIPPGNCEVCFPQLDGTAWEGA